MGVLFFAHFFECGSAKICSWISGRSITRRNNLNRAPKKYELGALDEPTTHMRKIKTKTIEAKDQNAKIEKSQKNRDPKKSPNALLAHPREPRTLILPTYSSSLSQK